MFDRFEIDVGPGFVAVGTACLQLRDGGVGNAGPGGQKQTKRGDYGQNQKW